MATAGLTGVDRPPPPPLFKYVSLRPDERLEWLEGIIVGRRLRLSSPLDFNDPFDCLPEIVGPQSKVAWQVQGRRWMKRLRANFGDHLADETWAAYQKHSPQRLMELLEGASRRAAEIVGVTCLTEAEDSVLMWSHYADNHRGVCLRFDLTQFPISDLHLVQPVKYQHERPTHPAIHIGEEAEKLVDKLLIKAKFWEYESEWRVLLDNSAHKFVDFPSNALTGVTFGARCPNEHRATVREMIANSDSTIEIREARISRDRFELDILTGD